MPSGKLILITGCSEGGLGDALAQALHAKGHHVLATARNQSKTKHLAKKGIDTLALDVMSTPSIEACVAEVSSRFDGRLDMLINNAGGAHLMPLSDTSITEGRRMFDLNVWSVLEVTQAFLPLLRRSAHGGMIVNNTSILAVATVPFMGAYCASKAAVATLTDALRLEMVPLGIKVIDLRTGGVKTNIFANSNSESATLPSDSMYSDARDVIERALKGEKIRDGEISASAWGSQVADALSAKTPAIRIWKGGNAWLVWFANRFLPSTTLDRQMSAGVGIPEITKILARQNKTG